MQKQKFSRSRMLISAAAVTGVVAIGGYAFTASNTVPTSKAGDGQNTITGYTVSSVHYGLNGTDPTKMDSVAFTLDTAPVSGGTVKVQVVNGGSWYSCSNTGTAVTCSTTSPQATVVDPDQLRVVVAQ